MGDYTKLIVHAEVRCSKQELLEQLEELHLNESAYHCDGVVEHIEESRERLNITLVGQTKYGRGQEEFIEWLRPHVLQGSGPDDVFAIQFCEYDGEPCLYRKRNSGMLDGGF